MINFSVFFFQMGVFKGRKKKGLSLSYKKRYNHLKLYRAAKKSFKHSKPLKSSTPCLHKTGGNTPSKHRIKRKIYSTTKARTPFKSPLLKKARTVSPAKRLNVSMLSPISTLDCKTRTPRKSKRTLNYNETPVSKPMTNEFLSNTDSLINENKVDETILYSDGEMSDRSFDTDDSSHDLETIKQMSDDDISVFHEAIERLREHNLNKELVTFLTLVARGQFPLNNVAFLSFIDVVKWFSCEDVCIETSVTHFTITVQDSFIHFIFVDQRICVTEKFICHRLGNRRFIVI